MLRNKELNKNYLDVLYLGSNWEGSTNFTFVYVCTAVVQSALKERKRKIPLKLQWEARLFFFPAELRRLHLRCKGLQNIAKCRA